ncbi:hypothetical protein SAMN05216428_102329 [Nitrosospira sp. Nsp11]|uniref:hypothetical protein n=1 Tax=Nitrosospira sp. Nsp11 TaxID=1855338 RepID=UPI00091AFD65|nr:hypothetical protein [Nitrosospira sp. Nsp11]SHL41468.1 hypothetical protein SAMN05216428_102329 [Nitrosospira sp. Nsp11]
MNIAPVNFVAGKGTQFVQEGTEVVIYRDDMPLTRVPSSDLLEYAKALCGIEGHLWPDSVASGTDEQSKE